MREMERKRDRERKMERKWEMEMERNRMREGETELGKQKENERMRMKNERKRIRERTGETEKRRTGIVLLVLQKRTYDQYLTSFSGSNSLPNFFVDSFILFFYWSLTFRNLLLTACLTRSCF